MRAWHSSFRGAVTDVLEPISNSIDKQSALYKTYQYREFLSRGTGKLHMVEHVGTKIVTNRLPFVWVEMEANVLCSALSFWRA